MQIHMNREKSVDILRGIAVLLMIMAHAIAYFYEGPNPILNFIRTFGDTTAFVMFVFVAGATTYFAYLDYPNNKLHSIKANRIVRLLLEYYFVAFISSLENLIRFPLIEWPGMLFRILLLVDIPDYTEFILTFVLFTAVLYFTQDKLASLIKSKVLLILTGVGSYVLGYLIFVRSIPLPFAYYTSLLAGYSDWFRFPVLQYLPVLLLGIYVGKIIDKDRPYLLKKRILTLFTSIGLAVVLICIFFPNLSAFPYHFSFNRWPPSIGFLAIGVTTALVCTMLLTVKLTKFHELIKVPAFIEEIFLVLGQYALSFFTVHIVLFELVKLFFPTSTTANPFTALFIIIISTILCFMLIKLREYISLKPKQA